MSECDGQNMKSYIQAHLDKTFVVKWKYRWCLKRREYKGSMNIDAKQFSVTKSKIFIVINVFCFQKIVFLKTCFSCKNVLIFFVFQKVKYFIGFVILTIIHITTVVLCLFAEMMSIDNKVESFDCFRGGSMMQILSSARCSPEDYVREECHINGTTPTTE